MKTLITGATGFIGRRLTRRLASLGRELRCAVRPMSDTTALLSEPNIELVCADLSEKRALRGLMDGVDSVYHLALDYSRPAVDDVCNLLEVCLSVELRRFVYFSSIAAVSLSGVQGVITEETSSRPDTEYGRIKRAAEELLLEAHTERGFPVVIVRPTSVYGIGERNFWLPLFRAVHAGKLVRLFGDGSNLLSLCFIDNLIDGALLAEQHDGVTGQVYILSDERPYAFRDVVEAIAETCGVHGPRSAVPKQLALPVAQALEHLSRLEVMEAVVPFLTANVARWVAHYPCSIAKARAQLGFEPRVGLEEGVRRTVEWYRENGYLSHALQWREGALDLPALPKRSDGSLERWVRASGRVAQLAWRMAALTWRLPAKAVRVLRRRVRWRA